MDTKYSRPLSRIALAVPEQRLDLGISQRELALVSGVSTSTIRKLERGRPVAPALMLKLAVALTVLELHELPTLVPAGGWS